MIGHCNKSNIKTNDYNPSKKRMIRWPSIYVITIIVRLLKVSNAERHSLLEQCPFLKINAHCTLDIVQCTVVPR